MKGCDHCGVTLLRPTPTAQFYDEYYRVHFTKNLPRSQKGVVPGSHAAKVYAGFRSRAERIAELVGPLIAGKPRPVLLEIGAAHGMNLSAVQRSKPDAQLFEDELDRRWQPSYVEQGIANWRRRPAGIAADLVILSHVLEHFVNPIKELHEVAQSLALGGLVYIEVPNTPADDRMLAGAFKIVHPVYFDSKTLRRAAAEGGLEELLLQEGRVLRSVWKRSAQASS